MGKKVIVFDFDGTCTDAEEEGIPFVRAYLAALITLSGGDRGIEKDFWRFHDVVVRNPTRYAWKFRGVSVAPSVVDPYLRCQAVAELIFDERQMFIKPEERQAIFSLLYGFCYEKTTVCFRQGALETLLTLHEKNLPVYVVTNSGTDRVRSKIIALGSQLDGSNALEWLQGNIHGSARKNVLDERWTGLEKSLVVPNLGWRVPLRRLNYWMILEQIRNQHGVSWTDMWVVGDIFALDLSVPFALGANVVLQANGFTLDCEKEFLRHQKNGHVITSLRALLQLVGLEL